jgi:hypothetical protein
MKVSDGRHKAAPGANAAAAQRRLVETCRGLISPMPTSTAGPVNTIKDEAPFRKNPSKPVGQEGMTRPLSSVAVFGLLTLFSVSCPAQERPDNDPSRMSREQWRAYVQNSRERADNEARAQNFHAATAND